MKAALEQAIEGLQGAIEKRDPRGVDLASRIVYVFSIEAAITEQGDIWANVKTRVQALFQNALDSLADCSDERIVRNVRERFEELGKYFEMTEVIP